MKVLQINTVYKNGGSTGRIVYDLKGVMENEHINGYVAFGYGYVCDDEEREHLYRIDDKTGLMVSKVRTKLIGRHGFDNTSETKRLLEWIENVNPDIVHLHNIHNHYVNIELLLTYIKEHNVPCLLTMHDCWTFTGHCAYFDYSGCKKWITGCNNCPSLKDYPKTFALADPSPWNYRHKRELFADMNITLVTPSRWLKNLVGQSFLKDKPCVVINNGVDVSVFKPTEENIKAKLGIDGKIMILAMASGFTRRKGIDYLLQLSNMLNENEVLVLVGVKDKQKKMVENTHCIAVERTNDVNELVKYYSSADVFINTTLEDNFPTTNIEALSCGTPVVTFDTGGSIESVIDAEDIEYKNNNIKMTSVGAVVPQRDLCALLFAVRDIYSGNKQIYQDACQKKVRERYNKLKQYMKYVELYNKLSHGQ